MSKSTFDEIIEIRNEESVAASERCRKRIYPILQTEFNRARAKHPDLERVTFGNRSFVFCFREGSRYDGVRNKSFLPKTLHRLYDLCEAAQSEAIDDLISDKKRARRLIDLFDRRFK